MAVSRADCHTAGWRQNGIDHSGRPILYLRARPLPSILGRQAPPSQSLACPPTRWRWQCSTFEQDPLGKQPTCHGAVRSLRRGSNGGLDTTLCM